MSGPTRSADRKGRQGGVDEHLSRKATERPVQPPRPEERGPGAPSPGDSGAGAALRRAPDPRVPDPPAGESLVDKWHPARRR